MNSAFRAVILSFVLLVSFQLSAQSKRKLNKQLNAEYTKVDRKVDSLIDVSIQLTEEVSIQYKKFDSLTIAYYFSTQDFDNYQQELLKFVTILKSEKHWPIEGVSTAFVDSVAAIKMYFADKSQLNKPYEPFFGFSKTETIYAERANLTEQNDRLWKAILVRENEAKALERDIRLSTKQLAYINSQSPIVKSKTEEMISLKPRAKEAVYLTSKELETLLNAYDTTDRAKYMALYTKIFKGVHRASNPFGDGSSSKPEK